VSPERVIRAERINLSSLKKLPQVLLVSGSKEQRKGLVSIDQKQSTFSFGYNSNRDKNT